MSFQGIGLPIALMAILYSVSLVSPVTCFADESKNREQALFFESNIRPLLSKKCYECHQRQAEGDLRLDSRKTIFTGGSTGPAIVAGKPEMSLLMQAISRTHEELEMPPEKPLSAKEIGLFRQWIADGAVWPDDDSTIQRSPDEHGITAEERAFWSFQPITKPSVPEVENPRWAKNPIDAFIAAKHSEQKLSPVAQAIPRTLLRRITFDLTGLPPTYDEIQQFETSCQQDFDQAYQSLIQRLLDSSNYGQRWAQHWLDLVRYADTAGDASDFPVPDAYKYRNYVIDAFNQDLPYDQFVKQQIAGDLLPSESEEQRWQQITATGYLAMSRRIGVNPPGQRHIMIEDTINNLGKTFLGLTIGCARCHDHKFDPIPTADYYALYGIFDSTIYPHPGCEAMPYRENMVYRVGQPEADQQLAPFRKQLSPIKKEERAAFESYRDFQKMPINIPGRNRDTAWQEVLDLRDQYGEIAKTFPNLETAYAVHEGKSHDTHVQLQGNPQKKSRGDLVPRGFLQVLGAQTLPQDASQSGRLELANWIASEKNTLTARVMVNRIWHHHFGQGLVASTSDFGVRGTPPSHPELLDYLANYFMQNGWSVKAMHRLILSSQTYRLAASDDSNNFAIDPTNHYLWRAHRRRLDAEQIRDSLLALSDQLDHSTGQRHPFPHRLTYFYRQHEPFVAKYDTNQRSIFMIRQRIRKVPYLDMFNAADGNQHIGVRNESPTSLQSLYFLNSPFVHDQADAIANRIVSSSNKFSENVQWMYESIYGRQPTSLEIDNCQKYLNSFETQVSKDDSNRSKNASWSSYVRVMLSSNEFIYLD